MDSPSAIRLSTECSRSLSRSSRRFEGPLDNSFAMTAGSKAVMSAHILVKRRGSSQFQRFSEAFGTISDSKFTRVTLREGDEVILSSAGGGGYGPPGERPHEHVLEDVREGFVSPQGARDGYGVEVDG